MVENIDRFNPFCGCTENVSDCNTVVKKVDQVPNLADATRNHIYLLPDNTSWIVNSDGTGFAQINGTGGSGTGGAYDDTELRGLIQQALDRNTMEDNRLVNIENKNATQDQRLEALENNSSDGGDYDDTEIRAELSNLYQSLSELTSELENITDNDTKYNLNPTTKTLLSGATLKNLIESHDGTKQPLILYPSSILNGIFSMNARYGNIRFEIRSNGTFRNISASGLAFSEVVFLAVAIPASLVIQKTALVPSSHEVSTIFVGNQTHFYSNRYILSFEIALDNGLTVGVVIDLVEIKDAFEASPTQPVVTKNITFVSGEQATLEVYLEEDFYTNTKFSITEIGKYDLQEI